jgi:hypothetical protein
MPASLNSTFKMGLTESAVKELGTPQQISMSYQEAVHQPVAMYKSASRNQAQCS